MLLTIALVATLLGAAPGARAYVYFSANTAIYRANLNSGGVTPLIASGPTPFYPYGIAVSWNRIYWVESHPNSTGAFSSSIGRANLDGTGVNHNFIRLAQSDDTYGVAINAGHIYWAPDLHGTTTPSIGRALLSNGKQVRHNFITGGCPNDVAVDPDHIYWTNPCTVDNILGGTIGRAGIDGSSPDQAFVIPGVHDPFGIAVDSNHLYWTNRATDTVARSDLGGQFVKQSLAPASVPSGVDIDDGHLYWNNDASPYTVGRADLDGSAPNQLFISAPQPYSKGVAVDGLTPFSQVFQIGAFLGGAGGKRRLGVHVSGPGSLRVFGGAIETVTRTAKKLGRIRLRIVLKGWARRALRHHGELEATLRVRFDPVVGDPHTKVRLVHLTRAG